VTTPPTKYRRSFVAALTILVLAACNTLAPPLANEPGAVEQRQAAIAMPEHHAANVSEAILRSGGNAVDAAVAAGFVLSVTLPEAGNIGGGGFMLVHMNNESSFLDYRETAPLAANRDMYLDENGDVIENASLIGARATAVPGTVAGLWAAHQRFGSMPWRDLVMPAVQLAQDGFIVPKSLADQVEEYEDWFAGTNFGRYFGKATAGERFYQPELANTLQRIADHGPDGFYAGETATKIVEFMRHNGGLVSLEDLRRYKAVWREPLRARWREFDVISAPPPSMGGFAVIQLLKMKQELAKEFEGLPHNSPQYIHLIAEMEKRVFADRAEYLGDPDFVDVRLDELLSDEYIVRRAREVNSTAISTLDESPPGLEPRHTTHYSILDAHGNAVSNTYTLNWTFGSGDVVEGAGFLLNDEMDDFSVKPGVPNIYGVVGSTANEIQPGKRMLSSMAPTIMLREGSVSTVIGTPGGSTIFTSVFQGIVNMIEFGMSPFESAGATRFHHQLLPPDLITYSPGRPLPDAVISTLHGRGYTVKPHDWEFGDLQIIHRDGAVLQAGSDRRYRGESRVFSIGTETR
jgi:gamma-glutamyltranspeptidase/glutathione hydrolase